MAALLINLAFDLVMLPRIGIVAGAYGTDNAYAVYVGAHLWICYRLVGLELRRLAVTLVRVAVAVAAMCAVLFAFGTDDVPLALLVVGGALGALAYAAALLLTREVSPAELRRGRASITRVIRGNA